MDFTVWVGGSEINSHYLQQYQAIELAQLWRNKGYDDVIIEEKINE
jgi:hypothetical protein